MKQNQLMEAAIIKVDKARFELKLSLRKSDTMPNPDKVRAERKAWLSQYWIAPMAIFVRPLPKAQHLEMFGQHPCYYKHLVVVMLI